MLDVTCMLTCTAGALVEFQLRKTFLENKYFLCFQQRSYRTPKAKNSAKKDSSTESTRSWIFLEFREENISGEAFCEGKQTRNLLNGSIQILDGIMRQFCEFMNPWVESKSKKTHKHH